MACGRITRAAPEETAMPVITLVSLQALLVLFAAVPITILLFIGVGEAVARSRGWMLIP